MAWTTALTDLRTLLSDGATDKLRYRKRMLNPINGTNTRFKTFEFRRLTNFKTEASLILGVFKNSLRLSEVTDISADFPEVGEVALATAPVDGDVLEASYYAQWFTDTELTGFLRSAAEWLQVGTDANSVPPGLQPAGKYYAAQEAYHKMASRWAELQSETFRLEDAPAGETKTPVEYYRMLALDAQKKSTQLRDDFYSRSGQQLAPLFGVVAGNVPRIPPNV